MRALLLVLLLVGCAGPVERVVPTGKPGTVPMGWVIYCHENPQDPSCPRPEP
jgi:hypothetical protein